MDALASPTTPLPLATRILIGATLGACALCSTAWATPVGAQGRWEEIGKTRTGNPVYVERRTVNKGKDGIVNATIRVTYVKPVKTPKGDLTASRAIAMFDCAKMTFATKENATYIDEARNVVFQRTVNKIPGFGPAIAGNFADVALQHFCKK